MKTIKILAALIMCFYVSLQDISAKDFKIEINRIIPQSGRTKFTSNEYSLEIKDSKLTCYLPFIGSSDFSTPGENPAIDIDQVEVQIETSRNEKKECSVYKFSCTDKTNTEWTFNIQIFDNGTSYINCTSNKRSPMSYDGEIKESED